MFSLAANTEFIKLIRYGATLISFLSYCLLNAAISSMRSVSTCHSNLCIVFLRCLKTFEDIVCHGNQNDSDATLMSYQAHGFSLTD